MVEELVAVLACNSAPSKFGFRAFEILIKGNEYSGGAPLQGGKWAISLREIWPTRCGRLQKWLFTLAQP